MIIYQDTRSKKKKSTPQVERANAAHSAWLKTIGYTSGMKITNTRELPRYEYQKVTSDLIPGAGGYKKSVDDYKWRRDVEESAATIAEIERKKSRVAPLYSKGATQYITDGADPKTIGRKV